MILKDGQTGRSKGRMKGREMRAGRCVEWTHYKGKAEGEAKEIKRGKGKQYRAKLAEKDGVKTAIGERGDRRERERGEGCWERKRGGGVLSLCFSSIQLWVWLALMSVAALGSVCVCVYREGVLMQRGWDGGSDGGC